MGKKIIKQMGLLLFAISTSFLLFLDQKLITEYNNLSKDDLILWKKAILDEVKNSDGLREILRKELGRAYEDNLQTDFDNYLVSRILSKISDQIEIEKHKKYNRFIPKREIERANCLFNDLWAVGYPISENAYYVAFDQFGKGTSEEIETLLKKGESAKHLILDLRDNPGGLDEEAIKISSLFIKKGTLLFQKEANGKIEPVYSMGKMPLQYESIIILMNDRTASAAELLILSMKENLKNVRLVGTKTYGKDVSYIMHAFKDGSGLSLLSHAYRGRGLYTNGILPDIKVGRTMQEYMEIKDPNKREEAVREDAEEQMKKALEVIR